MACRSFLRVHAPGAAKYQRYTVTRQTVRNAYNTVLHQAQPHPCLSVHHPPQPSPHSFSPARSSASPVPSTSKRLSDPVAASRPPPTAAAHPFPRPLPLTLVLSRRASHFLAQATQPASPQARPPASSSSQASPSFWPGPQPVRQASCIHPVLSALSFSPSPSLHSTSLVLSAFSCWPNRRAVVFLSFHFPLTLYSVGARSRVPSLPWSW